MNRTKKMVIAFIGCGVLVFAYTLFCASTSESKEDKAYRDYFLSNYKIFGLTIPSDLNFAGEKVPLTDFIVRENMDRELLINTYYQSQTVLLHKRAKRWFPLIEPVLKRNKIPDDFKYLALIESNLTNVVSPRGATGFWQIMESTGKIYNLEINEEVDERYHIEKSTEVACKYFKEAYDKFKDWTLVAASYNMGIGGVESQLMKQKVNNFYDLLLNEETSRYIYRILSIKELISRPKNYGYLLRKKDLYPPIKTYKITIDSAVTDFAQFALNKGLTYKLLKYFNPWLRKTYLTNKTKKTYELILPQKGFNESYIDDIGGDEDALLPDSGAKSTATVQLVKDTVDVPTKIIHLVKRNESLSDISKHYQVSEDMIKVWNSLNENEELKEDRELIIFKHKN